MNIKFQNAIQKIHQTTPPIWMMRQAGRYQKRYQKMREKYSFMELCKIPELSAEVANGAIEDFQFDVAILFSDILFPLEALGMGLEYTDSGPALGWHLTEETIQNLKPVKDAVPFMDFQKTAMEYSRKLINKHVSLIGFIGGAWTLFCYAVEGKHSGNLIGPKKNVTLRKQFIPIIEDFLIENIRLQLEGGAEMIMMMDTAAGALSPEEIDSIIIPTIKRFVAKFPNKIGYYINGASESTIKKIMAIPSLCGIGFDHRIPIENIMEVTENRGFIQGNFDPTIMLRNNNDLRLSLHEYLGKLTHIQHNGLDGWVCGLGHGVLPGTPEDNVKYFVETVRDIFFL